jgi:hypothetical protein
MVTVDGKVYEVDVEVAPEPAPTLPTFLPQSGAAVVAANPSASALQRPPILLWTRTRCVAAPLQELP